MKKLILTIVALLGLAAVASAQQPAAGQPPAGAGQKPAAPAVLPKGKIGVINTTAFNQQILEFRSKIEAINKQFEPRVIEVRNLADRITALENTIKTQSSTLSAPKLAEMTEQLESMKRDYQRKTEDLQADGNRARDRMFEPLNGKLYKFAQEYSAKRGIILLIDLANAAQAGAIVWVDARADITQDFINEYNKANPVPTAAPAPTKP